MDENKQIEEMALAICRSRGVNLCKDCEGCWQDSLCLYQQIAMSLYGAGYRKQSEGKWKFHKDGSGTCSECRITQKNIWDYDNWQNFCGHCGAKMKGE